MTHSVEREVETLEALLKPGRTFRLCGGCTDGRHENHVMPCECDSWNDANRINPQWPPHHRDLKLAQQEPCSACGGTGYQNPSSEVHE